jgi:hypothetical protein
MVKITRSDLTTQEQVALLDAAEHSNSIPSHIVEEIKQFVDTSNIPQKALPKEAEVSSSKFGRKRSQKSETNEIDLSHKCINSLVLSLDKMVNEDIPKNYEQIESKGGHSEDQLYYHKQQALDRSRSLMTNLKSMQS